MRVTLLGFIGFFVVSVLVVYIAHEFRRMSQEVGHSQVDLGLGLR